MNYISRNLKHIAAAFAAAAIGLTAVTAFGQDTGTDHLKNRHSGKSSSFCNSDSSWSEDRASFREVREMTISSVRPLTVDGGQNGGISITGEDRSDVLIRACVQAWGSSEEGARTSVGNIRIGTVGTIKAESSAADKNWSVSYQISVPRSSDLNLTANNGGISISGVDGTSEFTTKNGGIKISNLSGNVKGRTTNGGVKVMLSGTSWRGTGLDVQTTNGGVKISMPANFAALVETGTVNGGFVSDIPGLQADREELRGRRGPAKISTALNGGGAPIRISTTNGGVNIHTVGE